MTVTHVLLGLFAITAIITTIAIYKRWIMLAIYAGAIAFAMGVCAVLVTFDKGGVFRAECEKRGGVVLDGRCLKPESEITW